MKTLYHAYQCEFSGKLFADRDECTRCEDESAMSALAFAFSGHEATSGEDLLTTLRTYHKPDGPLWRALRHVVDSQHRLTRTPEVAPVPKVFGDENPADIEKPQGPF